MWDSWVYAFRIVKGGVLHDGCWSLLCYQDMVGSSDYDAHEAKVPRFQPASRYSLKEMILVEIFCDIQCSPLFSHPAKQDGGLTRVYTIQRRPPPVEFRSFKIRKNVLRENVRAHNYVSVRFCLVPRASARSLYKAVKPLGLPSP